MNELSTGLLGHVELVFVGEAEQGLYTEEFLETVKLPIERVRGRYLGARSDISQLLSGADIFVMPSGWEGFSVAAIEAVQSGIRAVFSDIAAFDWLAKYPWHLSLHERRPFFPRDAAAQCTHARRCKIP